MSGAHNYLEIKLDKFNKEHDVLGKLSRYDGDLKKRWKQDYNNRESVWRNVNSVDDLHSYIDRYTCAVEREKANKSLSLDTYEVDLALYHAIYAIQKAIHCFDMNAFDFNSLSYDDIDDLFWKITKSVNEMKDILICRTMWN